MNSSSNTPMEVQLRRRTAIPKSSNRSVSELSMLSVCVYCIFVGSVQQKRNPKTQRIDFPSLGISNFSLDPAC